MPAASCSLSEAELPLLGESVSGNLSSSVYFSTIETPENRRFCALWDARFGHLGKASADAELAYVAVHLLARAAEKAGSDGFDEVRAAVRGLGFEAPQGGVRVDPENLHCWMRPRIGRSRSDGTFEILVEYPAAVRPDPYLTWANDEIGGRPTCAAGRDMSRSIRKNFRGLRALLMMGPDSNRDTLQRTLEKLGLDVVVADPQTGVSAYSGQFEVLFFDADDGAFLSQDRSDSLEAPSIAVIGSEAPSRLAHVVRCRAASHILKPVRSSGVFTALLLADNEHAFRKRQQQEMLGLRRRLAGRRIVMKAVLDLIRTSGLCEDEAYEWLRREAMGHRISMEDMARLSLGLAPEDEQVQWRARRPD